MGDSNLFHEVQPTGWLSFFFSSKVSVATIIKDKFAKISDPWEVPHLLRKYVLPPVEYPLYPCYIGHSDRIRLASMKELMERIPEDCILVLWLGQHDTWSKASSLNIPRAEMEHFIQYMAFQSADKINKLEFEAASF